MHIIGDVFRMCMSNGESFAFSDCQIVRIYRENDDTYCDLVRPYVLTDGMVGAETMKRIPLARLDNMPYWQKVKR